jgi:hypothetical protein
MAAISRLDPVAYIQHPDIISHLFRDMTKPSEFLACSRVSKLWRRVNTERNRNVFIQAIKRDNLGVVVELLGEGLSPKFRIAGTKFVACAEDTPYLYAKSLRREKIAAAIKEKEGTFSEEYVKKKLDCLHFDLANFPLWVQGQRFQQYETRGVGHEFHHEYLLSDLIDSLKAFFAQRPDCAYWNQAKSKELISALERSKEICPSCETKQFLGKTVACNELVIFSDTSAFNHTHWFGFAVKNFYHAVGNRGYLSEKYPGARVYKSVVRCDGFKRFSHEFLQCVSQQDPSQAALYLESPTQRSPSCSKKSLEGVTLGAIGVILCDEYNPKTPIEFKQLHDVALSIFDKSVQFAQERSLNRIMKDTQIAHDQDLYVRFLTSIKTTSEVAVNFYHFLSSLGPIPWFGVDKGYKIPCDYVPKTASDSARRDYFCFDQLLDKVSTKAKEQFNPKDFLFWNQVAALGYKCLCGFDVQKGKIIAYASIDNNTSDVETASKGLLKISYSIDTQNCSANLIIPVKERVKLLNVFIWLIHARTMDRIKFTTKITKYLSDQDCIDFDIYLDHSCQLGWFFHALQDAYKPVDISPKYSKVSKVRDHITTLKTIDRTLKQNSYLHLCNYVKTLKPST